MPLKDYTTSISAVKSAGQIQGNLVAHGAKSIMLNYTNGVPSSLSFIIATPHGDLSFRLPAKVEAVKKVLEGQRAGRYRDPAQPARVAWRILKDWVDAQLAIIETEMVMMEQVFLPYLLIDRETTLYESMDKKGFYLSGGERQ